MAKDDTVISIRHASLSFTDVLTDWRPEKAQVLLQAALEMEVLKVLDEWPDQRTDDGRQRGVRSGYHPARKIQTSLGPIEVQVRKIQTSLGPIEVQVPKIRANVVGEPVTFRSQLVPPCRRQT